MVRLKWREPAFGNTFEELNRLRREMNRVFDAYHPAERAPFGSGVFPPVNIYEDKNNVYVTAELPGMDPNSIDISIQGDNMVLKGERVIEPAGQDVSYHRKERRSGVFNRVLTLPERVDATKVSAEYNNGMLKVVLPKLEEAKARKIEVSVK